METRPKSDFALTAVRSYNFYLNSEETSIVVELVNSVASKVMIEIGCNRGHTARTLLDHVPTLERYIGVDVPFEHEPSLRAQRGEIPVEPAKHAAADKRFYLLLRSSMLIKPEDLEPCDAVFIDGDHSERAVLHDSDLARALLRPGGIIIWHDFNNESVEVTPALHRLHSCGWPIVAVQSTWLAFCKF